MNVLALKEPQVRALFATIGRPEALEDPRFANAPARMANYDATYELIAEPVAQASTAEWLERFARANVPAAAIRPFPEVLADPQFAHRNTFIRFPRPGNANETVDLVRAGYQADRDGPDTARPPPAHGEHTDEILAELGFSATEIGRLKEVQVV